MRSKGFLRFVRMFFLTILLIALTTSSAWSASYKVLHAFSRTSILPSSGLVVDTAGNAYGTTSKGGNYGGHGGTVYQLSPTKGFSIIYAFNAPPDGIDPQGNVVLDAAGNLYGTTFAGGANTTGCFHGCGTVFRLTPPTSQGGSWTETILYSFTGGNDGANPQAGVILDSAGNLYGTTELGGNRQCGVIFELLPSESGQWTENLLYSLIGDGCNPLGGLVFDATGNLYGTTAGGGTGNGGIVFELSPSGGNWDFSVLYNFDGFAGSHDGFVPVAGVIFDPLGNLYSTTRQGGEFGFGTVFELTPNAGSWTENILYSFAGGKDGASPTASLVLDAAGNLDGTTFAGGAGGGACQGNGCGTAFELMPGTNGLWTERLFVFPGDGHLGLEPAASLLLDAAGRAYGTTISGADGGGAIFRIVP